MNSHSSHRAAILDGRFSSNFRRRMQMNSQDRAATRGPRGGPHTERGSHPWVCLADTWLKVSRPRVVTLQCRTSPSLVRAEAHWLKSLDVLNRYPIRNSLHIRMFLAAAGPQQDPAAGTGQAAAVLVGALVRDVRVRALVRDPHVHDFDLAVLAVEDECVVHRSRGDCGP